MFRYLVEVKRSKGSDEGPLTGVVRVPEEAVSPPVDVVREFDVTLPSCGPVRGRWRKDVECFATRVVERYRGL